MEAYILLKDTGNGTHLEVEKYRGDLAEAIPRFERRVADRPSSEFDKYFIFQLIPTTIASIGCKIKVIGGAK